jgi:hypothetical protein
MKRTVIGILALGVSLTALVAGAKSAHAAEPCPSAAVQKTDYVVVRRPGFYNRRLAWERWRFHQRELARRRWLYLHGY